jgi:hypothetical protein
MSKQPDIHTGRALVCAVIAVAGGVVIADLLPPPRHWNWVASVASIVIWVILFFIFCWKRKS